MAWSISDLYPQWGDTGEKPPENKNYTGGEQVNEKHLDYLWYSLGKLEDEMREALEEIDEDKDGTVDEADNALEYKGNDIDPDGDGQVVDSEHADEADNTENVSGTNPETNYFRSQNGGTVPDGDFVPIGTFGVDDKETLEVTQAMLTEDGYDTPAPDGINLVLVLDDDSSEPHETIISGDGDTMYDDEEGSPLSSYENTSGSHRTAAIAINNGDLGQSGVGSEQVAYGGYIAKIV